MVKLSKPPFLPQRFEHCGGVGELLGQHKPAVERFLSASATNKKPIARLYGEQHGAKYQQIDDPQLVQIELPHNGRLGSKWSPGTSIPYAFNSARKFGR